MLLHGWSMRRDVFRPQVEGLSQQFRVIAADLRGHGDSSGFTNGHEFDVLVDDLMELLVSLDLWQVILIGWSMGAMIAWGAMQRPGAERIAGIVSIDMVPRLLNDPDWHHGIRQGSDATAFETAMQRMRSDWPKFVQEYVPRLFARDKPAERQDLITTTIELVDDNDPESMARLWGSMADQDYRDQIEHLAVPMLVTYGEQSQFYDKEASEWLVSHAPNATMVGFPKSGHALQLEESEKFNEEVRKFAASISNRDDT